MTESATRTILADVTLVTCRWDDQPGVEPGWYCESWRGESMIMDSQKIWFPVSVDAYTHDEDGELRLALAEAFAGAVVVVS